MVDNVIRIMESAIAHNAHVIAEHPVGRGGQSQFAIPGREAHSTLFDVKEMKQFIAKHEMEMVVFDQCRTDAATQKTTQLMCSRFVLAAVRSRLAHLMCDHAYGTHAPIVGKKVATIFEIHGRTFMRVDK